MKGFTAKGECGENHTFNQRMKCKECIKIAETKWSYEKDIWNEALEDAAKTAEKYEANMIAYEIRMRKKK